MSASFDTKLTAHVKRYAKSEGVDLVGVAAAESFKGAPKGHRPGDLLKGAESVVVMAIALPAAAFESAPSREYSMSYLAGNRELDRIAFRVAKLLQEKGYRAAQVPASPPYDLEQIMGDLSHRHAGELAGIGVFGKNSLLMSPKHGPRVRLVSVITDARLRPDKQLALDLCRDCDKCIRACPVKALLGDGKVDKPRCNDHHMEVGRRLQLGDWEQICGVCIRACPVGGPRSR